MTGGTEGGEEFRCEGLVGDREELVKVDWCPSPCWTPETDRREVTNEDT